MGKRIKPGLLAFAQGLGAVKGGRPDWYRVAEHLASEFLPELLVGEPDTRGEGRPRSDLDWLAMEVVRVMGVFNCGQKVACRKIARGDKVPLVGKPNRFTKGSRWKGENPGTLEQRFQRWKDREKERQAAGDAEIRKALEKFG